MIESNPLISEFERALLMIDKAAAEKIIIEASASKEPIDIASEIVTIALGRIGDSWSLGKASLSQVYMSGIICEQIIDKILPPKNPLRKDQPKMGIAVFDDFHVLGKRIIYSTLRASGFELLDLGSGLKSNDLVKIVHEQKIKILLLSVLMLPSALKIKEFIKNLDDKEVKIIVGGSPFRFDENLWMEVGADGMGKNPSEAINIVNKMMGY
jgi:methanogenic corrinoid protein MtbC1